VLAGHKEHALEVPFDPSLIWNLDPKPLWRGRRGFEVECKLKGLAFESFIVPRQKKFFMLVDDAVMKSADLRIGELVKVVVGPKT
jgi:uncharacterized protein DUF1905